MPYRTEMQKGLGDLASAFIGGGDAFDKSKALGTQAIWAANAHRAMADKYGTEAALNQDQLGARGELASSFAGAPGLNIPGVDPTALATFARSSTSMQPQDIPAMLSGFQKFKAGNTAMNPNTAPQDRSMANAFAGGHPMTGAYNAGPNGVIYNEYSGAADTSNPLTRSAIRANEGSAARDYASAGASSAAARKTIAELEGTLPGGLNNSLMAHFQTQMGIDNFTQKPQYGIDEKKLANFSKFWAANRKSIPDAEQAIGVWLSMQPATPGGGPSPAAQEIPNSGGQMFTPPSPMMGSGGAADPLGIR